MKTTLANQVWQAALALCAVFILIAMLAQCVATAPAATLPSERSDQPSLLALPIQPRQAITPELPATVAQIRWSNTVPDLGNPDDVSRLRTRSLTLPVLAINAAQLIDSFTEARGAGVSHEALDIMAARGTPVLAVDDGRIVKLFLSVPGGVTLYQFDPSNEYAYYYAHLDRYADGLTEGSTVRKGQVIAYVGSTGNASVDAPHLHFAIMRLGPERQWWRGTPINPFLIWRGARP